MSHPDSEKRNKRKDKKKNRKKYPYRKGGKYRSADLDVKKS